MSYKPHYQLKTIKALINFNKYRFQDNALETGSDDFGWGGIEMSKVILKLNERWHQDNPSKNHFYKTEIHTSFPNTKMDYYKIMNGLEGNSIYTHFYIHPDSEMLVISSFKEL
ncbi:MAG: type II toxin-antitoxin system MqsR family toxin [Desulfotalea sp.]